MAKKKKARKATKAAKRPAAKAKKSKKAKKAAKVRKAPRRAVAKMPRGASCTSVTSRRRWEPDLRKMRNYQCARSKTPRRRARV